jgi:hypothetical protein
MSVYVEQHPVLTFTSTALHGEGADWKMTGDKVKLEIEV